MGLTSSVVKKTAAPESAAENDKFLYKTIKY
jgi:hypothetical protein